MKISKRIFGILPILSGLLTGCLSTYDHHVKSANAKLADTPLLPPINNSQFGDEAYLGIRVGYRTPETSTLRIPSVNEDGDAAYYPAPGTYSVRRGRYTVGVDYRATPFPTFDYFFSGGLNATPGGPRGSTLMGVGGTIPFPWLNVRFAPALGMHYYRSYSVDSIVEHYGGISGLSDTSYIKSGGSSFVGFNSAISLSAWLPQSLNHTRWTPFIQYQYQATYLYTPTVSLDAMSLYGMVWALGLNRDIGKWGSWNSRLVRETIYNDGSKDISLRVESGLEFKVGGDP